MNKKDAQIELDKLNARKAELEAIVNAPEITPEQRFWMLCQGLTLKTDWEKYPTSVFFFKGDEVAFEYDTKSRYLYCRYSLIWSVFEIEFSMKYDGIQSLIKKQVEDHFGMKPITPTYWTARRKQAVEDHFGMKPITPHTHSHNTRTRWKTISE